MQYVLAIRQHCEVARFSANLSMSTLDIFNFQLRAYFRISVNTSAISYTVNLTNMVFGGRPSNSPPGERADEGVFAWALKSGDFHQMDITAVKISIGVNRRVKLKAINGSINYPSEQC